MSTSGFIVVRLDALSPDERERRARDAADWLLEQRVLAPLAESEWGFHEHALGKLGPGPRWRTIVQEPIPEAWHSSPGEEVNISSERELHSALGNYEAFACATCDARLPDDDLGALVDEWLASGEPRVQCAACGSAALLGDWPSEYPPALVGGPTVTFYRWPHLRGDFVAALAAQLGGERYRSFWTHF